MSALDAVQGNQSPERANRLGQATAVEQSRAVAEVQAAIVVAQQCPRSVNDAIAAMRESCQQTALAERAFYRFPRGGQTVTGPSVHLARELARCWGNLQYGIAELRRDDEHGQSEMQAYAWDVQTNTRSVAVFVVPHKRDKRGGPEKLVDMRDIYENNANNGARRLREAIYAILPPWFTEEAKELCSKTLSDGGGKPMAQRIADAVKLFSDSFGVTVDQLEQKLGRARDRWTEHDIAQLTVTFKSLRRGELTVDEEFAPQRVSVGEITGATKPPAPPARERSDELAKPAAAPLPDEPDASPAPAEETPGPGPGHEHRERMIAALRGMSSAHPEYPAIWERMGTVVADHESPDSWADADPDDVASLLEDAEKIAAARQAEK